MNTFSVIRLLMCLLMKNSWNKKSIAVRFKFGSDERTLLNEEVKNYMNSLINTFKERGIDIKS